MRVLVLSDIHANLQALEAVLAHAGSIGYDTVWNLGDVVGYGPQPQQCLARLNELPVEVWLAGNHDGAAVGTVDIAQFNPVARESAVWTATQLNAAEQDQLKSAPFSMQLESAMLAHGSPRDPVWEYVTDTAIAAVNFTLFSESLCFVGHSHIAAMATEVQTGLVTFGLVQASLTVTVIDERYILNPGSVGQPRDMDPRAAWCLFETESMNVRFFRTRYDIATTQALIRKRHLPEVLARRLELGR